MEPNWPKTDSHVAQQCRRDRLRASCYVEESLGNFDQATGPPWQNQDTVQFHCSRSGHLLLDEAAFSSEIMNLSRECNASVGFGDSVAVRAESALRTSLPQFSLVSQSAVQNLNWVVCEPAGMTSNDSGGSRALGLNLSSNPNNLDCIYESGNDLRKNEGRYHCGQSTLTNHSSEISSQDSSNRRGDSNTLLEFASSAAKGSQGLNVTSLAREKTWGMRTKAWPTEVAVNELTLLPAYPQSCINVGMQLDSNALYDKASNPDDTAIGRRAIMAGINCRELRNTSLTLSSNFSIDTGMPNHIAMVEHLPSNVTVPVKGIQDVTGISTAAPRNSGPLGPFTGYASILKSSKFMKPAQQLLHEMCGVPDSFMFQTGNALERSSEDLSIGADAAVDSFNGSSSGSLLPEYQQMKANLLHMQEEVCKRYRQYQQQMHMVFSSFQTVAGLNAATPYISLALETILRNFDFVKNAILYQLRHMKSSFGKELLFPSFGASCNKEALKVSKMKCMNRSFPNNKCSAANEGRFDSQRVLRLQRGLPEHAIVILRAWLFEHFLHPYPTDTDKHILARQTGLSRNQVSNWFINARVRVWKPMVEEIHLLETKHQFEPGRCSLGEAQSPTLVADTSSGDFTRGSDMHFRRSMTQGSRAGLHHEQEWSQMIRRGGASSQYPLNIEGASMAFTPTPCGGVDFREVGSESLALGLRRNGEFGQHWR